MSSRQHSHKHRQASKPAGLRVLVCGDRNWQDATLIELALQKLHAKTPISFVIEGECRGADLMARAAADMVNKALDTIGTVHLIGHNPPGLIGSTYSEQILRRAGFPL